MKVRTGLAVAACAGLVATFAAEAQQAAPSPEAVVRVPLEVLLSGATFPQPRDLTLAIASPPTLESVLAAAGFPGPADLRLAISSPPSLAAALAGAQFPAPRDLTLGVLPPPLEAAILVAPMALSISEAAAATPELLAPIATANFPTPQPLSVTLVPQATPLSAIATANFPAPQPLSVTLVPPPTPLAAIATANFPVPQPLAVTLYAGESLTAAPLVAGILPGLTLARPVYTVQIVQVIPRRGVNFFDRIDPTGQATLVAAGATPAGGGGATCIAPPGPPLGPESCGSSLSLSDDGIVFGVNLGPQGNRSFHVTPVGGTQIQIAAQTGITPTAACPNLLCTVTQVFTPGAACDGVSYDDTGTPKSHVLRFRRNGAQVCAQLLQ